MAERGAPWWRDPGVAGRVFRTKGALEEEIRAAVVRSGLNQPVRGADLDLLVGVLEHHYKWTDKVGVGLDRLECRRISAWNGTSTGLVIVRQDGSEIDISWRVALMPLGRPSPKANVVAAARYEVVDQRNEAAASVPMGAPCELCGLPLEAGQRHVDHEPPLTFDFLVRLWLEEEERMDWDDVRVQDVQGVGSANSQFVDRELAQRWWDFHKRCAVLRVIHKHENLSRVE